MFWLLLGLGINISVHWLWFLTFVPLTHADAIYILPETFKELIKFSIWQSNTNIGGFDFVPSFYPFNAMAAIIASLGGSTALIQRIIFFWPIVIFGTVTSYMLSYQLTKHKPASFIATLVFNFNTFFIISSSGHITLSVAYTLFPLILYVYHRYLKIGRLYYLTLASLILFACSFWEFRAFYVVSMIIFIMYVFELACGNPNVRGVRNSVKFFLPIVLTIIFNTYWLLPIALDTQKEVLSFVAGRTLFKGGTENANMLVAAFTLFHLMWSGSKIIPFSVNPIPLYFFLTPLIAFSTILVYKKNTTVIFYTILALFGIVLSKFFFPPFPSLYEWMFQNIPGFSAFREPSKFTVIIYLAYSVLFAFFVKWSFKKIVHSTWRIFLIGIISLVFLTNTIPIISNEAGALFTGRTMPRDYAKLNAFISKQPDFFRTLWIPRDSRWGIYTNSHPKINAVSLVESKYLDQGMIGSISELTKRTDEVLMDPNSDLILDALSIKYVIIPLVDEENDDDFFQDYEPRSYYLDKIAKNPTLIQKDIGLNEVLVYENINYENHIYAADQNMQLQAFQKSPYSYHLVLNKPRNKTEIFFSESYHPGWKLYLYNPNPNILGLLTTSKSLTGVTHKKTQFGTNSFTIDPAFIDNDVVQLYLYFQPQQYAIIGGYLSILSIGAVCVAAIYLYRSKM